MKPEFLQLAAAEDSAELAELHSEVATDLTSRFGKGPWSSQTTVKGVAFAMRHSRVLVAREAGRILATLQLATKKPWAIDPKYFSKCRHPVYLLGMAVRVSRQREGIGSRCLEEAKRIAAAGAADAIRLDAYDAAAGAGQFYAHCGWAERGRVVYRGAPLIYFEQLL